MGNVLIVFLLPLAKIAGFMLAIAFAIKCFRPLMSWALAEGRRSLKMAHLGVLDAKIQKKRRELAAAKNALDDHIRMEKRQIAVTKEERGVLAEQVELLRIERDRLSLQVANGILSSE